MCGCPLWTVPWWARRARARQHPSAILAAAGAPKIFLGPQVMQSLSQVGLTGGGGKKTDRKAEPEICEWCGTYRVLFLSYPTSSG